MGLLTDKINNKLERSNLINEHALNREPVPLKTILKYHRFSLPAYSPPPPLPSEGGGGCTQATLPTTYL